MTDVATALRLMVGGDEEVSRFHDPQINDAYDIQLRLTEGTRNNADEVTRLYIPSSRGELVRLDNLVQVKEETTASRIDRLDRQRQVSIRAGVGPGYALAAPLGGVGQGAGGADT